MRRFRRRKQKLKKILSIYDLRCECCFAMPAIASSVKNREFIYEHNGFLSRAAFITGHPLRITNDRRQFLNKVSSVKSQVKFKKIEQKASSLFFWWNNGRGNLLPTISTFRRGKVSLSLLPCLPIAHEDVLDEFT